VSKMEEETTDEWGVLCCAVRCFLHVYSFYFNITRFHNYYCKIVQLQQTLEGPASLPQHKNNIYGPGSVISKVA
jgi:hypothetical protein